MQGKEEEDEERTFNTLLHAVEKFFLPRLAPQPLQKLAPSVAQSKLFLCGDEAGKDSTHLIHICKARQRGREGAGGIRKAGGGKKTREGAGGQARKHRKSEKWNEEEEEERLSRDTDNGGSFSVLFEQRYEGCFQTWRVAEAKQPPRPSLQHRLQPRRLPPHEHPPSPHTFLAHSTPPAPPPRPPLLVTLVPGGAGRANTAHA